MRLFNSQDKYCLFASNCLSQELPLIYIRQDPVILYIRFFLERLVLYADDFFRDNVSVTELRSYKYTCNRKLNKIVDRLPTHIKYVKQLAIEERVYVEEGLFDRYEGPDDYEIAA